MRSDEAINSARLDQRHVARFWQRVKKSDGCWEWQGPISTTGYGRFTASHRCVKAHRFGWAVQSNSNIGTLMVCHRCDNRKCVRLSHLFVGTMLDNARDQKSKGRHMYGEVNGRAILQEGDVLAIRSRWPAEQIVSLAREFGVGETTLRYIVHGRSWKHLL